MTFNCRSRDLNCSYEERQRITDALSFVAGFSSTYISSTSCGRSMEPAPTTGLPVEETATFSFPTGRVSEMNCHPESSYDRQLVEHTPMDVDEPEAGFPTVSGLDFLKSFPSDISMIMNAHLKGLSIHIFSSRTWEFLPIEFPEYMKYASLGYFTVENIKVFNHLHRG